MSNQRIDLIRQALGAAESSVKLAKQLLNELEGLPASSSRQSIEADRPGVIGVYDGEKMVTEKGDNFPVPANYASKSLLVVGDTLKLYEENGEKRFKQIEHVKRHKTNGLLVKKEGKFRAITSEGSYKVLPEAVAHFKGDVGDEVVLHVPAGNMTSPYGAIETLTKKTKQAEVEDETDNNNELVSKNHEPETKSLITEKKAEAPVKVAEKKEEPTVKPTAEKAPVIAKAEEPLKSEAPKAPETPPAPKEEKPEPGTPKLEPVKAEVKQESEPVKDSTPAVVAETPQPVAPVAEPVKAVAPDEGEEDELS